MSKRKKSDRSLRLASLLGFLVCVGSLGFAAYLQFSKGLPPCPLCILQRIAMMVLGLLFLVGALHTPKRWWHVGYSLLVLLFAIGGFFIAHRQVWLEQQPSLPITACGASLNYMLQNLPFKDMFYFLMSGTADCARVDWLFWGWSIPEWTRAFFGLFILIGGWHLVKRQQ